MSTRLTSAAALFALLFCLPACSLKLVGLSAATGVSEDTNAPLDVLVDMYIPDISTLDTQTKDTLQPDEVYRTDSDSPDLISDAGLPER